MGYQTVSRDVTISKSKRDVKLGKITLSEETHQVEEVAVVAQKSTMKLDIDKKVFNVDQDIASAGGSASDALENIPSVEVDSEGNVSLRGSSSVTVWINGKAQGMTSDNRGDILQQLPSESIDHIEVITNPSSKYSAEGSAGIINIVLKRDRKAGYYGGVQVSVNDEGVDVPAATSISAARRSTPISMSVMVVVSTRMADGQTATTWMATPPTASSTRPPMASTQVTTSSSALV